MQGNPPPTPLYAAHRFAQRGFPRRLGPSRVAPSTINEILKQHFNKTNKKFKRAGFRKPVHVCDSMDLCACGFETRAAPSDSLATAAHFISWNHATALNVLLESCHAYKSIKLYAPNAAHSALIFASSTRMASMVFVIKSSNVQPSMSAPCWMTSRWQPAANL